MHSGELPFMGRLTPQNNHVIGRNFDLRVGGSTQTDFAGDGGCGICFYTNDKKKAESLVKELAKLGYEGGHDIAAEAPDQFVITGWTIPIKMSDESVVGWTGRMCDLGHKLDCEFDGWGANPNP